MKAIYEFESMQQENEAVKFFASCIMESIKTCNLDEVTFYEDMTFDDYRNNCVEGIWDDNNYLGEGINLVSCALLIDEDNPTYIESFFEDARDKAYNKFLEYLVEEIDETQGYLEEIQDNGYESEYNDWNGEIEGYRIVCSDSSYNDTYFEIEGLEKLYYSIINNGYDITLEQYALWLGATHYYEYEEENEAGIIYYKDF